MELFNDGVHVTKPKITYILEKKEREHNFLYINDLKWFLDEYASNISILMNLNEWKLCGMKSHDCYVFM